MLENKNFLAFWSFSRIIRSFCLHLSIYAFELAGMKPKTDFWNRTAILAKSEIITLGVFIYWKNHKETETRCEAMNFSERSICQMHLQVHPLWMKIILSSLRCIFCISGVRALRIAQQTLLEWCNFQTGLRNSFTKIAYWTHININGIKNLKKRPFLFPKRFVVAYQKTCDFCFNNTIAFFQVISQKNLTYWIEEP